jgi:hypothetical protein
MNNQYIIIACYPDKGMKSSGSKGLLSFNKKKLIDHQISWIKNNNANSSVSIVADFEYSKIQKSISSDINIINAEGQNPILMCCEEFRGQNLCFIDYGCIFRWNILSKIKFENSQIICIKDPKPNNNLDVGCTVIEDSIEYMFFDLPKNKFCNIFSIIGSDTIKIEKAKIQKNLLYFEIINMLLHNKSKIMPTFISNDFIYFNHARQKNAITKFIKKSAN